MLQIISCYQDFSLFSTFSGQRMPTSAHQQKCTVIAIVFPQFSVIAIVLFRKSKKKSAPQPGAQHNMGMLLFPWYNRIGWHWMMLTSTWSCWRPDVINDAYTTAPLRSSFFFLFSSLLSFFFILFLPNSSSFNLRTVSFLFLFFPQKQFWFTCDLRAISQTC